MSIFKNFKKFLLTQPLNFFWQNLSYFTQENERKKKKIKERG